ncbi:DEAD/DEAH box helicase family protein [Clostridium estertheticum]|uniref:DEAD/DEAH box helicase n=1 Tax=Clostridium estertheticum TaxID=238834 RepID=UPI001CD0691B|nr:DEAD/DEAH box helicase family protein [Clostridium estertheticum]MBZ9686808.1 DEAD/DEAH box helicase family protein [Clostridium estertheticum]
MVNNKNMPLATWMAPNDSFKLGSIAEDLFIDIFAEVFGPENTKYLSIQHPFVDIYGNSRFIDFALESEGQKIAIEIDGETWHNPSKVSQDKYYDDLLKQNSLIYENWKIYRWVYNQLHTKPEMVKDELQTFLGELPMFKELEEYLPKQKGKAFILKDHQAEAIASLENMRKNNETIALLYHATGTGKTITAVTDAKKFGKRTLFIAHTKELVNQAKDAFEAAWSEASCGIYMGEEKAKDTYIVCASIQSLSGNLEEFKPEDFGYIIIDEAHHGTADTYKKILGYFKPKFTLGLSATPERNDGENVLELFKNVAHKLDLKTAVEIGELVPIRCIRLKTNVDLSSVRIGGIKYNSQDLESKLFVPERNNLLVDTYIQYVKDKKTVVFCASVFHAEEVAKLFKEAGVKAEAVSGTTKSKYRDKILKNYENGDIQVLCACDLLNEGWDSPKTQVLLMARPTMSKTIYMQQLGRGTRKSEGKDYLMVFDFIDNASLFNMPLSAHRMFDLSKYVPGNYVVASGKDRKMDEDLFRKGEKPVAFLDFPMEATDYELIDLFNWQSEVKDLISQIEFVRMVDVQSETIERYIREGKIIPDLEVPMGARSFKYFKEETVIKYVKEFDWEIINAANMKEKFMDMVKTMDMSYSYKPVLLKAMLEEADDKGKVLIEDIVDYFIDFYEDRKKRGLVAEKKKCIYNNDVIDRKDVKRNILSNPFKRFEDMRFMRKCRESEYVEFNGNVWKKIRGEEKVWIGEWCEEKLEEYYNK